MTATRLPYYKRKTDRISPPRSDETKARIAAANQIGVLETPWGYFSSSYEANRYIDLNLSNATILRMCTEADDVITRHRYGRNQFLKTLGTWVIGKRFSDIGFSFTPKVRPVEPQS